MKQFSKVQIATAVAILFHTVGFIGIVVFNSGLIVSATPLNLLLSFALLVWTQTEKNLSFWIFFGVTFFLGFTVEVVGVNTGWLFGNYQYGNILGPKQFQVPLLIGINWFISIFCCGISMHTLLQKIIQPADAAGTPTPGPTLKAISIVTDGATLAVFFDWLMEPAAVKLGYWRWEGNTIPLFNYACWFVISCLLLLVFYKCKFPKQNKFAVNLLLIQIMFFLLLRTFFIR
jgi:bisanhydrobacterioruberin hydratase